MNVLTKEKGCHYGKLVVQKINWKKCSQPRNGNNEKDLQILIRNEVSGKEKEIIGEQIKTTEGDVLVGIPESVSVKNCTPEW